MFYVLRFFIFFLIFSFLFTTILRTKTQDSEAGDPNQEDPKALAQDFESMVNDREKENSSFGSMMNDREQQESPFSLPTRGIIRKKPEPPRRSSRLLQKTRARSREAPANDETGSSGKGASRRPEALSEPYPLPQTEA